MIKIVDILDADGSPARRSHAVRAEREGGGGNFLPSLAENKDLLYRKPGQDLGTLGELGKRVDGPRTNSRLDRDWREF